MDGEPITLAQVVCAPSARIHISWGLGDELFCCDVRGEAEGTSTASCVQWGCLTAPQRRIAYDTASKYIDLRQHQEAQRAPHAPQAWARVLEFSGAVSAVLGADAPRAGEPSPDELQIAQERALWELLAMFSLDGAGVERAWGQELAGWLARNAVGVAGGAAAAPLPPALWAQLQADALPEAHPQYWPALQRLVATGQVRAGLELLGLHSAWLRWGGAGAPGGGADGQAGALEPVALLLKRFPALRRGQAAAEAGGREFDTLHECLTYRRGWQAQCAAVLRDGALWARCEAEAPDTAAGLRRVVAALAGEDAALVAAARGWAELLAARLLHRHPAASSPAELRQLAERCAQDAAGVGTPAGEELSGALAAALDACCDADAQSAMRAASAFASDWFMAHVPAVLGGAPGGARELGRELPHAGGSQVEFYALEYAAALAPHAATRPLAAAYLAWCPAHGRGALEAVVAALPLEAADARGALRAVELCEAQGLGRAAAGVCRAQGVACWEAGLTGAALTWLSRAGDARRADAVLRHLADAVWRGGRAPEELEEALLALEPALEAAPPGTRNTALLHVHKLLLRGPGGAAAANLHAAVAVLAGLPPGMRALCLPLVCSVVATATPAALTHDDCLQLLAWLEAAPAGSGEAQHAAAAAVARVALVRLVAACHMSEMREAGQ